MLQFIRKISLYMAPTYFGPSGPSSGSMQRNLDKITVTVEIISYNTLLKLLCSGNTCFSLWSVQWVLSQLSTHQTISVAEFSLRIIT